MNSTTLKNQRNDFINQVSNYVDKYQVVLQKINTINAIIDSSKDNLLYSYIIEQNSEIIKKINELKSDVENYKKLTLDKVDQKIIELERLEKQEREQNEII